MISEYEDHVTDSVADIPWNKQSSLSLIDQRLKCNHLKLKLRNLNELSLTLNISPSYKQNVDVIK